LGQQIKQSSDVFLGENSGTFFISEEENPAEREAAEH
jgi:hypothetical protein